MWIDITELKSLTSLARKLISNYPKGAVVLLRGELGAGKTTFVREVAKELAALQNLKPRRITSPSFTVHQHYTIGNVSIDHFDFYRIQAVSSLQLAEVGYTDALEKRQRKAAGASWIFVEWPEHVENMETLEGELMIIFFVSESQRTAQLSQSLK